MAKQQATQSDAQVTGENPVTRSRNDIIAAAMADMDQRVDGQWNADGSVRIEYMQGVIQDQTLTPADIAAIDPDFRREARYVALPDKDDSSDPLPGAVKDAIDPLKHKEFLEPKTVDDATAAKAELDVVIADLEAQIYALQGQVKLLNKERDKSIVILTAVDSNVQMVAIKQYQAAQQAARAGVVLQQRAVAVALKGIGQDFKPVGSALDASFGQKAAAKKLLGGVVVNPNVQVKQT